MIGQPFLPCGVGLAIRQHPQAVRHNPGARRAADQDVVDERLVAPAGAAVSLGGAGQRRRPGDRPNERIVLVQPAIEVAEHDKGHLLVPAGGDPLRHQRELRHQRHAGGARCAAERQILAPLFQVHREQAQRSRRRIERDIHATAQMSDRVERDRGDVGIDGVGDPAAHGDTDSLPDVVMTHVDRISFSRKQSPRRLRVVHFLDRHHVGIEFARVSPQPVEVLRLTNLDVSRKPG